VMKKLNKPRTGDFCFVDDGMRVLNMLYYGFGDHPGRHLLNGCAGHCDIGGEIAVDAAFDSSISITGPSADGRSTPLRKARFQRIENNGFDGLFHIFAIFTL